MIIALGKPGTLMPAFADEMGGSAKRRSNCIFG